MQNRHRKPRHRPSDQHQEAEVRREKGSSEVGVHLGSPIDSRAKTRGGSMSRKRRIRGKSNHDMILRQPCKYFLKGTCTISPCECWHPPECQFCKTESCCKAVDKCLFPHHNVDEQPKNSQNRATIPTKEYSVGLRRFILCHSS